MRRTERESDSWSGHWSCPGGRREASDLDLLQTALRELEEECGITLSRNALVSEMPSRYARRRAGAFVQVTPFVIASETELAVIPDALETAEAVWLPLSILRDPQSHRLMPVQGLPPEMRFPAVEMEGTPLWGFTYRLLTDWIGAMQPPAPGAGFDTARSVLEYLRSRGFSLRHDWEPKGDGKGVEAELEGELPTEEVIDRFCGPGKHVNSVNCLEVRSDYVRILGPGLEEYVIRGC
jgi:ADP-ribose pyrophosphatase YjhB (NUDIX family)